MSQVARKLPATQPALIMFDKDRAGRPHAAWFNADEANDAERASGVMGYTALPVTNDDEQAFAVQLPRGRLCLNGRARVYLLPGQLFERLRSLAPRTDTPPTNDNSRVDSPPVSANEGVNRDALQAHAPISGGSAAFLPQDWDAIGNGSLVLAYDPASGAWYEALVVGVQNEALRLTWRDYPEEGVITRQRKQLALLHPDT